ncbi:MAG: enoyl-CoA hydratase, partial [Myxococcales bacterium]|nr:enoyl-CoA hydratase [Myxococcales bacterium]
NAMRWLLTGDVFDAAEALRIGLVQEVTEPGAQKDAALAIAKTIASRAPLGVRATLESSRAMLEDGPDAAAALLLSQARALMGSDDAAEGLRSFVERRDAVFKGK